jgi:hypothetical protein
MTLVIDISNAACKLRAFDLSARRRLKTTNLFTTYKLLSLIGCAALCPQMIGRLCTAALHPAWQVRCALVDMARVVLTSCSKALGTGLPSLLDLLVCICVPRYCTCGGPVVLRVV